MTTTKREVCQCEKCGNEAEMTVTCELVDVAVAPKVIEKKTKEHRVCSVCGNEADLIIAYED